MNRGADMTVTVSELFLQRTDRSNLRIDKRTELLNFGQEKIILKSSDLHTRFDFFIHVKGIFINRPSLWRPPVYKMDTVLS